MFSLSVKHFKYNYGFTLMELLFSLIILSLMLGVIIPNFSNLIERNKINASSNNIITFLNSARLEAMHYHNQVVICPSFDHNSCNASNFSSFIMFNDKNNDSDISSNEKIIKIIHFKDDLTIQSLMTNNTYKVIFLPNGTAKLNTGSINDDSKILVCSKSLNNYSNIIKIGLSMGTTEVDKSSKGCEQ